MNNQKIEKILDTKIISPPFKIKETPDGFVIRTRNSKFNVKIPEIDKDVAYLTGVILGDGNVTLIKRKVSKYPRTKIKIYNSSMDYISYVNDLFLQKFSVNGRIWKKTNKECYVLEINNKVVFFVFQ